MNRPVRALSLLSGGLDSQLAVCVLKAQGIAVEGIVFESPFFGAAAARVAAARLAVDLHVLDFTDDIISLVEHPPHGFGTCMNPCIDCHARMLKRAGDFMKAGSFDFLSTGEVLNERPMSQNRQSLGIVARDSGFADVIVRPLSARLLPETTPEREGWVDRSRLLALSGRGRKPQIELARQYGLTDYPTPAGGCRLTEPGFGARLKDLKEHGGLRDRKAVGLLTLGRHLRLSEGLKLIVGRNQKDNELLEREAKPEYWLLRPLEIPGPTCLLPATAEPAEVAAAAGICAGYSDVAPGSQVSVQVSGLAGDTVLTVTAVDRESIRLQLIS